MEERRESGRSAARKCRLATVAALAGAVALAGAAALSACREDAPRPDAAQPVASVEATQGQAEAAAPVGATRRPEAPRLRRDSIEVGELRRTFAFHAPAGLPPGAPLVLVFHGSGMTGEEIRPYLFFDDLADLHGFAVAYPDGLERRWNGCRKAAPFAANRRGIDDVGFVRALVRRLADRLAIDPARVFAVGVSGGGHMALRLALEAPDAVAGVAALGANLPAPDELDCAPASEAVPLLLLAGTADRINPYGGGRVVLPGLGDLGVVRSACETAEYFRRLAGHAAPPERLDYPDVNPGDGSRIEGWTWRALGRAEVTLLAVHGGGHTIPHPTVVTPERFGPTNADIEAAAEIWAFFRRQLPAR